MFNIETIIRRVQGLLQKTIDNGCTEAEALAAAEMVAKIMSEHGLAMSDIEIKARADTETGSVDCAKGGARQMVWGVTAIADFFDCKSWRVVGRNGRPTRFCFFGFPEDVAAAKAFYQLMEVTIINATTVYKAKRKRETGMAIGLTGCIQFRKGMTLRIASRLRTIKKENEEAVVVNTGRDLVVVKGAVVDEALAKLDMKFTANNVGGSRRGDRDAYAAGQVEGDRFSIRKKLTA